MATIIFISCVVIICKLIKAFARAMIKVVKASAGVAARVIRAAWDRLGVWCAVRWSDPQNLAADDNGSAISGKALEALQEQRDLINEQIRDIEEQLDFCPPAKIRNQYMNRKTVLLGKLATVERRIAKTCA